MLSNEQQKLIKNTFDRLQSIEETIKELGFNYRTIIKYINRTAKQKCDFTETIRVYQIVGLLNRTAKILGFSRSTIWRVLKSQNIDVGKGSSTWKRLYLTLRRRVSKSQWRKDILERDNYQCIICNNPSKTVHHIKKLSDLRDEIVKNYPHINPFNSFQELRAFTDLVMALHINEDGAVLCKDCHEKEHSKY